MYRMQIEAFFNLGIRSEQNVRPSCEDDKRVEGERHDKGAYSEWMGLTREDWDDDEEEDVATYITGLATWLI